MLNNNNNNVNISTNKTIESTITNNNDIDISTPELIKFNSTTDVAYKPVVDVASKDFKDTKKYF